MFITDTLRDKAWQWPLRVLRGRGDRDFKLVDHRGAIVRRFSRWRYAYKAYVYLCEAKGWDPMPDDAAYRELVRDRYERGARAATSFKQNRKNASLKAFQQRNQVRDDRQKRADRFWKGVGGKPSDLPTE